MVDLATLLPARCTAVLSAIDRLGGTTSPLAVAPPSSTEDVVAVETQLGIKLPAALRNTFLRFSGSMDCFWQLPDDWPMPVAFREIFCGECKFALSKLVELEQIRAGWVDAVFSDPSNPYDSVWRNKLAFQEVRNGDMLAIDLAPGSDESVVYLSHDGDDFHGTRLGADFADFLLRWSKIGFVGAEDWQFSPFVDASGYLNPDSEAAVLFRKHLGWESI